MEPGGAKGAAAGSPRELLSDAMEKLLGGDASTAVKQLTAFIEAKLTRRETVDAMVYCNRAMALSSLQMHRRCLQDANSALAVDGGCLRAHWWRCRALAALGKMAEAREAATAGLATASAHGWGDAVILGELLRVAVTKAGEDAVPSVTAALPAAPPSKPTQLPAAAAASPPVASTAVVASAVPPPVEDTFQAHLEKVSKEGTVQFSMGDPQLDRTIALGYFHVNSGHFAEAIELFSALLERHPSVVGAYLGRGSAYAMTGKLVDAVNDFSRALLVDPKCVEALRRRGQSLMAMNEFKLALADLNTVARLAPTEAESYHQRGLCYFRMREYARARDEFVATLRIEPTHRDAWNQRGLALNQLGNSSEAAQCHERALQLEPMHEETHTFLGLAWKEFGDHVKADASFTNALTLQPANHQALYMRGSVRFLAGRHTVAMQDLRDCLRIKADMTDAHTLLLVALQGRGRFREAVAECDKLVKRLPGHHAWFHRRVAIVTQRALDQPLESFSFDRALEDVVKEGACKRSDPRTACAQQLADGLSLDAAIADVADVPAPSAPRDALLVAARSFGLRFQYNCPGFAVNRRQHLMAGVVILHVAQAMRQHLFGSSGGAFGWRDAFDICVRWRQLSEPNDPVFWVDLLPPVQFAEGFGSHTPIVTGQCHTIRYGCQLPRAMAVVKALAVKQPGLTQLMCAEIAAATDLQSLFAAVRRDFWVTTPCLSSERPGRTLEGTRLTLQYTAPSAYDFSIRTPGTPPRMYEYDCELKLLWARVGALAVQSSSSSPPTADAVLDLALRLAFYWYNCMPLSRGTAAIGLTFMHAVMLAFGWEIETSIPAGFQCDWDAILTPDPAEFCTHMREWMLPACKKSTLLDKVPAVKDVCGTVRDAIALLNCCEQ